MISAKLTRRKDSDLSVNLIDAPDYDAINQCKFVTDSEVTLVNNIDTSTGNQQVAVGPPQPIRSVSCSGMCVPTYGKSLPTSRNCFPPSLHMILQHMSGADKEPS
jgi:hypothetical protein